LDPGLQILKIEEFRKKPQYHHYPSALHCERCILSVNSWFSLQGFGGWRPGGLWILSKVVLTAHANFRRFQKFGRRFFKKTPPPPDGAPVVDNRTPFLG